MAPDGWLITGKFLVLASTHCRSTAVVPAPISEHTASWLRITSLTWRTSTQNHSSLDPNNLKIPSLWSVLWKLAEVQVRRSVPSLSIHQTTWSMTFVEPLPLSPTYYYSSLISSPSWVWAYEYREYEWFLVIIQHSKFEKFSLCECLKLNSFISLFPPYTFTIFCRIEPLSNFDCLGIIQKFAVILNVHFPTKIDSIMCIL